MSECLGIVAQRSNERAIDLVKTLRSALEPAVDLRFDVATANALPDVHEASTGQLQTCQLLVSIGGDGTFLYTATLAAGTPILGIDLGEVGFLTTVDPENAVSAVQTALSKSQQDALSVRTLPTLTATIDSGPDIGPAVNEIVVQGRQRGPGVETTFEVSVNDQEYITDHADGVLIATPTGSTAYNLSEGGPIVHPAASVLLVTPMCADSGARPLVVPADQPVHIRVASDSSSDSTGHLVVDGRDRTRLQLPLSITIQRGDTPVRIVGQEAGFFDALRKLA